MTVVLRVQTGRSIGDTPEAVEGRRCATTAAGACVGTDCFTDTLRGVRRTVEPLATNPSPVVSAEDAARFKEAYPDRDPAGVCNLLSYALLRGTIDPALRGAGVYEAHQEADVDPLLCSANDELKTWEEPVKAAICKDGRVTMDYVYGGADRLPAGASPTAVGREEFETILGNLALEVAVRGPNELRAVAVMVGLEKAAHQIEVALRSEDDEVTTLIRNAFKQSPPQPARVCWALDRRQLQPGETDEEVIRRGTSFLQELPDRIASRESLLNQIRLRQMELLDELLPNVRSLFPGLKAADFESPREVLLNRIRDRFKVHKDVFRGDPRWLSGLDLDHVSRELEALHALFGETKNTVDAQMNSTCCGRSCPLCMFKLREARADRLDEVGGSGPLATAKRELLDLGLPERVVNTPPNNGNLKKRARAVHEALREGHLPE
jgi:hypothetical protein